SQLSNLTKLLCTIESFVSVQQIYQQFGINPGMVCYPGLQTVQTLLSMLQDSVTMGQELGSNILSLPQMLRDMLLKDTSQMDWSISVFSQDEVKLTVQLIHNNVLQSCGLIRYKSNSNNSMNIVSTDVRLKSLFRNSDQMKKQLLNMTGISLSALEGIMTQEISNNFQKISQIISQILKLQLCFTSSFNTSQPEGMILQELCNQSFEQWFNMIFTFLQYLDIPSFLYRMVLPADFQTILDNLLKNMGEILTNLKQLIAAIEQLLSFIERLESLQLTEEPQFRAVVRGTQTSMTTTVTLDTLSKVLCYNGILSIFAIPQLSISSGTEFSNNNLTVQEQIEKYHIPQNSTPFCLAFYLDLVSTPEGIVMWSFLKPILRGKILYTPVTPETEAIMQKSNATLQEMDNLRQIAKDWVTNSKSVMSAIEELKQTLPVLKQNSLANPFVQNFISTQTDIDTEELLDTLHTFVIKMKLQKKKFITDTYLLFSNLQPLERSCQMEHSFCTTKLESDWENQASKIYKSLRNVSSVIFKMPPKSNRRRRADPGKLSLPKLVKYTIRMDIQLSMRTDSIRKTVWVPGPHNSAIKDQTYSRGFIYLQEDIERAIIELQTGKIVEEPAVQLQSMPYPCYVKDDFLHSVTYSFPLLLMIAWVLFVAAFVKKLVEEKELRLHEYMKMMGVSPCSHFCAWFIESAIFLLITVIIIIIVLKAGMILPNSNWFILLLYLIDYSFSILAMSYLISVFFHHTNIAGLSGSLIYIIAFFPFIVMMSLETELSFSAKSLLSLFSPTAFSYASQYIARFEDQGIGIQWHNMYLSPGSHDTASFGWLCWLMVIDSVMYFTVGWYIRSVFPGKYGIAAPWYFLFLPSYWLKCCGCARSPGKRKRGFLFTNIMSQQESGHSKTKGNYNHIVKCKTKMVTIYVNFHLLTKLSCSRRKIRKQRVKWGFGVMSVLKSPPKIVKNERLSMLTGLFSYSSGSIFVDGKDIQTDLDSIRKSMGVCMQYDVLFGYLTIEEHLLLYGHMKAPHWSKQKLQQEMENTLKETGLYAHRHKRVDALSGGMRRKLSLCIAFIGGSKTVILDEPTTGVDPCSRRSIWDIIIRNKKERTIVLSTHHLDEAEVLSDRIAFLERGGLKCSGSPFYLKETFKQGYNLTLTKKKSPSLNKPFLYDVSAVTSFIRSHIPTAQLKEDNGGELVYLLPPFTTELSPAYLSLLRALDVSLNDLQLGCYGISDTTLEEVFLRLTKDTNEDNDRMWSRTRMAIPIPNLDDRVQNDEASVSSDSLSDQDEKVLTGSKKLSGLRLFLKKVMAVGIKRFHHSRRDWKGMAAQVILPVLFVIAAMGLATIRPTVNVYPEKELSPSLYGFEGQAVVFGTQNSTTDPLVSVMLNNPGIDNKCLQDPSSRHCLKEDALGQWESSENPPSEFKYCSCSEGKQACPANEFSLPHKKSYSSQVIYNATGYNMENYLLSTTHEFLRKRYGAWSFSMPLTKDLKVDLNEVPSNKTLTKVWFNPEGYHSIPVYLNTLNNFILRANLPPTNDSHQYGISLSSHPYVGPQQEVDSIVKSLVDTLVALCILMGYSIMTASFVIYVVKEHQTGAKQLQHISGISVTFYWIINFFYDMLLYLVPVALSIAVIEGFHLPSFTNRENLGAVSLLFILFGYATYPWMYLLAGIFKDSEMAFISYVCINLFIGINTIISSSVIYFLTWFNTENQNLAHIYHVLKHVFLIFPQFCFGNGLMELSRQQAEVDLFKLYGVETYISPFQMDKVGWMFVAMAIQGTVFFTLRLLMNNWLYKKFRLLLRQITHQRSQVQVTPVHEDEDVKAEREHIEAGGSDTDLLQLDHLTKIYQHRQKKATAVNNICVGIPAGECFGLLGVNGAGKTTTFNMLTNEISPSTGKARIRNQDGILVDIADTCESGSLLGYCPQHDALDNLLTGEEHLYYYARIRGIPEKQVKVAVNHLIHRLDLTLHAAKPIFMYSCGTKRKLSTALALIGKPQILLLDEPSSGMDPKSKRQLWKTISEEVRDKCSVVLTSHSMEECEALCTRLAIMVKGQFRCIGSLQHIKNRFGSGFSVKMHLSDSMIDVSTVTEFMQSHFPRAYLKDKHLHVLEYHLSVAAGGVADIFDLLESNKVALPIKHFSVSQTTLDEVFINFAKDHADLEELDTSASEHISGVNNFHERKES
uniref:ATP binding cassette subfamily A member 12 n=1 Tax=Latimeria chalumnae TaxID=7897 RepID=H3B2R0_LATCH